MIVLCVLIGVSCKHEEPHKAVRKHVVQKKLVPVPIIDCQYSFEESVANTKAPRSVVEQLELIPVEYYSLDGKLHQGQILTNRRMVAKIKDLFQILRKYHFPVAHAIPVVKYNWEDEKSMEDNNTYSFCYRNASYSRHAKGLAIDINPYFNPVRWKPGYQYRKDKPVGASYDPDVAGTFRTDDPMVHEIKELGLRWGHSFSMKYDDHHFEMR